MKAVLSMETGGPETLVVEDVDVPTPGKGQVLIDVAACAINFPDTLIIRDLYQFKPPRPFSPGGEISVFPMVMLMQMMSAGAMGGGVSSAVARALGAGDVARANQLARGSSS